MPDRSEPSPLRACTDREDQEIQKEECQDRKTVADKKIQQRTTQIGPPYQPEDPPPMRLQPHRMFGRTPFKNKGHPEQGGDTDPPEQPFLPIRPTLGIGQPDKKERDRNDEQETPL